MKSSKCKTSKSNVKKNLTVSITSRTKWIKEVEYKMDGGEITSYDLYVGDRFRLHVWQMYGPGNKWNWFLEETHSYGLKRERRRLVSSNFHGETSSNNARIACMKAFIWYFVMRLARNTDIPAKVLKGFEDE